MTKAKYQCSFCGYDFGTFNTPFPGGSFKFECECGTIYDIPESVLEIQFEPLAEENKACMDIAEDPAIKALCKRTLWCVERTNETRDDFETLDERITKIENQLQDVGRWILKRS